MKCVCGYAHAQDKSQEKYFKEHRAKQYKDARFGDEDFITINGHFTVDSCGYYGGLSTVSLYACPECKTVQMSG